MKRLTAALAAALLSTGPVLLADDAGPKPEELFSQFDKDENGQLAKDEVPENQTRFFDRLVRIGDKNDDGELSREEFIAAMKQPDARAENRPEEGRRPGPGGGRPQFTAEMFDRLDANGDGKLTKAELPEQARERMGQMFVRLGKEELTREDLERMQERFGGEGRAGPGGPGGMGRPGPEMLARMKEWDKDKNGKVTLEEVPEEARERTRQMLERMGRDAIDLEQMARMIEQGGRFGPGGDRPRPEGGEGDRPRPEGGEGDRPRPEGNRPRPEMREGDRPRPEGAEGDRPRPEAREGDRPRPEGDRPRPEGDRPRPEGDRPRPEIRDGDRPRPEGPPEGDRPRPEGDRPPRGEGERPPFPRDGEGGPRGGFAPAFLRVLDANEDGALSREELDDADEKFDQLDRNGDGRIDRAELMGFGPGGPGFMRDGEGPPRGFGPRDGEGPPRGFGPRDGEGRPPEGARPPRDGEGRPPEGARPPRDGEGPPRDGARPPRDGERPPRDGEDRPRPERDND